jgi:hypothetical protein
MAGILNTRDYNLDSLILLTSVGAVELRYIMNEISYHEDLFGGVVSGYVMVTESSAYAELLALNGNEFLILTFSKYNGADVQIKKVFRAYKMDKRKLVANMATEAYCIQFCSEELLLSEQYKISKSYPNQTIDTIITDICTSSYPSTPGLGINPDKLQIDPTYGVYNFIIPNLKPLDAINWLSTYARPADGNGGFYPGADMVFYEDRDGFKFRSLQALMDSEDVYNTYSYDPKNTNERNLQEEVYNVTTYEILNSYDTLGAINSGMFANQLLSVDILTRRRISTNFDYLSYYKDPSSGSLNDYPVINNYKNRSGQQLNEASQSVLKLIFCNFDDANNAIVQANPGSVAPNIYAETYIPYRTAQLALANYTRLKISIPGDPEVTVGDIIEFELISKDPAVSGKQLDLFYSGYYLVTAVRHMITQNDFKTVLEVAKESVPNQYPDISNDTTTWSNVVST